MSNDIRDIPPIVMQRVSEMPYQRAYLEKLSVNGKRALRVVPVDGIEILDDANHPVACWNGLSDEQQRMLIVGNYGPPVRKGIRDGFKPALGDLCDAVATVLLETTSDETPGPRFYCLDCAIKQLLLLCMGRRPS